MSNNFITPLSRKIRIYLLLWSCFFVLLSMVMQKFYRPFIYANNHSCKTLIDNLDCDKIVWSNK